MGYDVVGKTPEGIDLYGVPKDYVVFEHDYSEKAILQVFSQLNVQGKIKTIEYVKDILPNYKAKHPPQNPAAPPTPPLEGKVPDAPEETSEGE